MTENLPGKYIVVNRDGLLVRSQMSTLNPLNVIRKMSNGEGFTVYQVIQQGDKTWGRLSSNPGDPRQQYACLSILGRPLFAVPEPVAAPLPEAGDVSEWQKEIDAWARFMGYAGVRP